MSTINDPNKQPAPMTGPGVNGGNGGNGGMPPAR